MEIPDVIVINKADHPLTDTMEREVRTVLSLGPPGSWKVPVLRTEAARGEGVAELLARIDEHRRHIETEGTLEQRRERNLRNEVLGLAATRLRRELEARAEGDPEVAELLARVTRREIDPASAARELLSRSDDG
jgi:GTPase